MPYKDIEKRRATMKKWRLRRKELGLCIFCSNPATLGHTRCVSCDWKNNMWSKHYNQTHREKAIEYRRNLRKRWRDEDCCIRCGRPLMREETDVMGVICVHCTTFKYFPFKDLRGIESTKLLRGVE